MGVSKLIRRIKKRFNLFWVEINQDNMLAIVERPFPAYYYLLYDEDEILEFHKEALRQVREILNNIGN